MVAMLVRTCIVKVMRPLTVVVVLIAWVATATMSKAPILIWSVFSFAIMTVIKTAMVLLSRMMAEVMALIWAAKMVRITTMMRMPADWGGGRCQAAC